MAQRAMAQSVAIREGLFEPGVYESNSSHSPHFVCIDEAANVR